MAVIGVDTTRRFIVLDGMRGIAALAVCIGHVTAHTPWAFFSFNDVAVDFFFILSGFVLAYSYGGGRVISLQQFMVRRFIRLYPLFAFGLLLGGVVLLVYRAHGFTDGTSRQIISSLIYNLMYLPFFNNITINNLSLGTGFGAIFLGNDPSWSLFFEIFVNFFFLAMVRLNTPSLGRIVVLSFVMVIVTGVLNSLGRDELGIFVGGGWGTTNLLNGVPRVFYGFSLGIFLYQLVQQGRFVRLAKVSRFTAEIGTVAALVLLALVFAPPKIHYFNGLYLLTITATVAPALIIVGATLPCRSRPLLKLCEFLGWLSYPLYCVHWPIMRIGLLLEHEGYLGPAGRDIFAVGVSVLVAGVAAALYDQPVRNWLSRMWRRRQSATQPQPAPSAA